MAKIGISEVATAAGVSTSTVSVILNNVESARVHPATRERVWRAASDLGYVPNGLARGLRLQRSDIIGFVSDSVATTPYAGTMILGAQEAAHDTGRLVVALDTRGSTELEEAALTTLQQRRVDGVLYAAMYHRVVKVPKLLAGTPTVLVNATSDDPTLSSVVPDEAAGVRMALAELIGHGHRTIGYIGSAERIPAAPLRSRAYRSALRHAGLPVHDRWIAARRPDPQGGYEAALEILKGDDRPTALFCFSDTMAAGAYRAALDLNLRIPADLSIVGYDNLELVATTLFPRLTTISLPHHDMGAWAARQLMAQIADPSTTPSHIKMAGELYRRESVAPPAV
jgi:LacI family transcriptional regulator